MPWVLILCRPFFHTKSFGIRNFQLPTAVIFKCHEFSTESGTSLQSFQTPRRIPFHLIYDVFSATCLLPKKPWIKSKLWCENSQGVKWNTLFCWSKFLSIIVISWNLLCGNFHDCVYGVWARVVCLKICGADLWPGLCQEGILVCVSELATQGSQIVHKTQPV